MGSGGKKDLGGENIGDGGQHNHQKGCDVRLQEQQPSWNEPYKQNEFERWAPSQTR